MLTEQEQLERKRHIGNDLVIIIYTESDKPFDISTVASRQIRTPPLWILLLE